MHRLSFATTCSQITTKSTHLDILQQYLSRFYSISTSTLLKTLDLANNPSQPTNDFFPWPTCWSLFPQQLPANFFSLDGKTRFIFFLYFARGVIKIINSLCLKCVLKLCMSMFRATQPSIKFMILFLFSSPGYIIPWRGGQTMPKKFNLERST